MTPYVRRDIWTLEQAGTFHPVTRAYALAVAAMQRRPNGDPTSWAYQATVHSMAQGGDQWRNQCQHNTWYFLPWHRMYLYWFERIVRSIVQTLPDVDDTTKREWALPYWGYGNGTATDSLPPAFLAGTLSHGAPNPLFVAQRNPIMNGGGQLRPQSTSAEVALGETVFSQASIPGLPVGFGGARTGWNHFEDDPAAAPGQLEITPHGSVHTGVGGFMSAFDTAPLDPIFWLHHANVDRLWVAWLAQGGRSDPLDAPWLSEPFHFHDEGGADVTMRPGAVLDPAASLGYEYDDVSVPAPFVAVPMPPEPLPQHPPELVGATDTSVDLTGELERVHFGISPPTGPLAAFPPATPSRVYLNIEDVHAQQNPGVSYAVYVDVPDDDEDPTNDSHYVGNLSFFGIEKADDLSRDHRGGHGGLRYAFEITNLYTRLRAEERWDEQRISVTIAPLRPTPPRGAAFVEAESEHPPVSIGRISLFYQ